MTRVCFNILLLTAALAPPPAAAAQDPASGVTAPGSTVCVAILVPRLQGVEGDATAAGIPIRELFASFLRGPSMTVVLLEARLPSHAAEEARLKECPNVLAATVTYKRRGGSRLLGRVIGQAGSHAAWGIPGAGVGEGAARGAAIATTQAISEMAASTRARDEVQLDLRVTTVDGGLVLGPRSDKARARADGEDLLTPMVERASEAVAAAVAARSSAR